MSGEGYRFKIVLCHAGHPLQTEAKQEEPKHQGGNFRDPHLPLQPDPASLHS